MTAVTQITIKVDDADQRLDRWLKRRFPKLGQGRIEKLLRTGQIRVDGKRVKAAHKLLPDQVVRLPPKIDETPEHVVAPAIRERKPVSDADAKSIRSWVIYKDDDVIVLDKPPGLAVQGGTGTERHIDGMLDALDFGDVEGRPKLVHRLDRDTSGVLVLARGAKNAQRLADSFRHRNARKLYWALVAGEPILKRGKIDLALAKEAGPSGYERVAAGGDDDAKRALTLYDTVDVAAGRCTWLVLWPRTGRTHQLRVHCADALKTPVVGDGKYGGAAARIPGEGISGKLHLHARSIELPHPSGKGMLKIKAPLPVHMRKTWAFFGFDPDVDPDPFGRD
jgi:23S rRNA pseudouridine955/2504/2580 synthase